VRPVGIVHNAERLCEVGKIREAENFFQFCKTVVVRWATVGRTSCSSGAAAPRCTEGERSEPFVQRTGIADGGGFEKRQPVTKVQ